MGDGFQRDDEEAEAGLRAAFDATAAVMQPDERQRLLQGAATATLADAFAATAAAPDVHAVARLEAFAAAARAPSEPLAPGRPTRAAQASRWRRLRGAPAAVGWLGVAAAAALVVALIGAPATDPPAPQPVPATVAQGPSAADESDGDDEAWLPVVLEVTAYDEAADDHYAGGVLVADAEALDAVDAVLGLGLLHDDEAEATRSVQ